MTIDSLLLFAVVSQLLVSPPLAKQEDKMNELAPIVVIYNTRVAPGEGAYPQNNTEVLAHE